MHGLRKWERSKNEMPHPSCIRILPDTLAQGSSNEHHLAGDKGRQLTVPLYKFCLHKSMRFVLSLKKIFCKYFIIFFSPRRNLQKKQRKVKGANSSMLISNDALATLHQLAQTQYVSCLCSLAGTSSSLIIHSQTSFIKKTLCFRNYKRSFRAVTNYCF